jgi:hypothetical protein
MEPEWTKRIPSWLVCDWFYAFFIIGAVISAGLLLLIIYLTTAGGVGKDGGIKLFMLVAQLGIALTTTLFYYIICARSLRPVA